MAHARRRLRALEDLRTQIETGIEALPEFFRLLRTYVDSDHGAYFHADRHGRFCGAYHEVVQHTPQLVRGRSARSFTTTGAGRREELQARFRMPLANAPRFSVRGA